ncbi:hypothetical protein TNIN_500631 [Trichonephila inaurata madagascariensis]|uniref:Uncharacterized protein n=1 Tax=Trichonephila inaurata madagascariensis TaxID=2747483 RepID=A0A8X6IR43_9ARAC|nr:hypothetical protein TNIN_500631 [Trichonephila inaurata madagascariensis]
MQLTENKNQDSYTAAYKEFHKSWDLNMNRLVTQLNSCRTSDECSIVIRNTEELDSYSYREFPHSTFKKTKWLHYET